MGFNGRFEKIAAVLFLCFFARPLDCSADKVFLKSGQEEEGRILEKNRSYVILYTDGVSKIFPESEIVRIVKAELPNSIPASKKEVPAEAGGQANVACVSSDTCWELGNRAISKGEFDNAIMLFDDAIRYDAKNANAYVGRGLAHLNKSLKGDDQMKGHSLALKDASEALRLDPSNVTGLLLHAKALRKLGRADESIIYYEKAMAIMPFLPALYSQRGSAYFDKGSYDSAISDYSKAIALLDQRAGIAYVLSRRAGAYVKMGDFDRAEVDCNRAIEIDPSNAYPYEFQAMIFAARKEYDRAWVAVRKNQELGGSLDPAFLEELKKNAPAS